VFGTISIVKIGTRRYTRSVADQFEGATLTVSAGIVDKNEVVSAGRYTYEVNHISYCVSSADRTTCNAGSRYGLIKVKTTRAGSAVGTGTTAACTVYCRTTQ
jgi:hypothetical protein